MIVNEKRGSCGTGAEKNATIEEEQVLAMSKGLKEHVGEALKMKNKIRDDFVAKTLR